MEITVSPVTQPFPVIGPPTPAVVIPPSIVVAQLFAAVESSARYRPTLSPFSRTMFLTRRPHVAAKFASYVASSTRLSGHMLRNHAGSHCETSHDLPCLGGSDIRIRPPPRAITDARTWLIITRYGYGVQRKSDITVA